jgi:cell wall-associated NlpC family hydrolase
MTRRSSRTAAGLLLGGLLASGLPSAGATPIGDAKQQAEALRTKVNALQIQAEAATEDYDAAYAQLGQSVTAHVTAQRDLDAAKQASGVSGDAVGRRVRALYMAGGTVGLYAHVLTSGNITEVAQRLDQVKIVLDGDQRASTAAGDAVLQRASAEKRLATAAQDSTRLQAAVAARADQVRTLLDQTNALLAAADQRVRDIAEAQQRAAEAAAAARAAQALAQAQVGGGTLPNVAASPVAAAALAFAQAQLGKPYVWGATGPNSFDCSGLTGAAYAAAGLQLPRTSRQQWFAGPHVDLALYAGNNLMVAAPHTGDVVKIEPVYLDGYLGAVRPGGVLAQT